MSTILAFAGSNSSTSINHQLVTYLTTQLKNTSFELFKLSDMDLVIYSEDEQRENGFPSSINQIYKHIQASKGIIISVNEHNSNPSAFFKNVLDWLSRLDRKFLEGKKIFLLSTSNGARGGMSSLEVVKNMLPRFGAEIIDTYALASFNENFSIEDKKISNPTINKEVIEKLHQFEAGLQ
ncbi:NADPH-dependent FMN reductase [Flavobacterium sp.]|uniref:NADPH-dependent FMN reductase n=1 Tax=Flavobacterium sp. TaxID=239 RepID=UPI002FD8988E